MSRRIRKRQGPEEMSRWWVPACADPGPLMLQRSPSVVT